MSATFKDHLQFVKAFNPRTRVSFFDLLSGKVEYSIQWAAWEALCEKHGANAETVLGLLNRAHAVVKSS